MKRAMILALLVISFILTSAILANAKELIIENSDFESTAKPREEELFFGWNPYYSGETNATIVTEKAAEGVRSLKLVGIEGEYVGVRSVRIPIEPGKEYTISLQAFTEEIEDPGIFQVLLEFWPVGYVGSSSKMRLDYRKIRGRDTKGWYSMSGRIVAPLFTDSASIFISISDIEGTVYVDDIRLTQE